MNRYIRYGAAAAALVSVLILGGCNGTQQEPDENLIGSGLEFGSDKIIITISNESNNPPLPLDHFTEVVEQRFPGIRLVQTGYVGDYENPEYIARVKGGDISDVVMVKAGRKALADMSPQLLDLSTQAFPGNFNSSSLEKDRYGRIYYIPGPLSLNGIIYNKTLFEERGWQAPKNYEELLKLSRQIDSEGIRGHQYPLNTDSMVLYAYSVCASLDILTTAEGQNWHGQFLAGENVSLEPMEKAFDDFETMIKGGLFRPEDMQVGGKDRDANMINRRTAMTAGEAGTIRSYNENSQDEFAFLPHFGSGNTGAWMLNLGYYFGANKDLEKPENEEKRQAVLNILDFISTEEGQQALIADGYGLISSVRGADIPREPVLEQVYDLVSGGRYIMRPVFYRFNSVLEPGTAAFLKGEVTSEKLLEDCQEIMDEGAAEPEALGVADSDFSVLETGLLKAAALREATETDVALVGMAEVNVVIPKRSTRSRFYKGPVAMDDVLRVANQKNEDPDRCSRALIPGDRLLAILEGGAVIEEEESGHFHPYAVSGLTLTYHLESPEGERVSDVTGEDGAPLDPEKLYRVSWLGEALPEERFSDVEHMDLTLTQALVDKIRREQTIVPEQKSVTLKKE